MSLSSQEELPVRRKVRRRCGPGYLLRGALLAEGLGTALLVLLSCAPACAGAPPAARAAAAGLAVTLLVQCFDHISDAMLNPVVVVAAAVARRVSWARGAALAGAQLLGAAAGGGLLRLLAPPLAPPAACLTLPAPGLPLYKFVLGGLLALASTAAWDARNRLLADSWPLRVGLSVAGLSLIAGPLTGAGMNPARSLAPALWSGRWEHHWVYWAGPLGGALASGLLYRAAWAAPAAAAARAAPGPGPGPGPARRHSVASPTAKMTPADASPVPLCGPEIP